MLVAAIATEDQALCGEYSKMSCSDCARQFAPGTKKLLEYGRCVRLQCTPDKGHINFIVDSGRAFFVVEGSGHSIICRSILGSRRF